MISLNILQTLKFLDILIHSFSLRYFSYFMHCNKCEECKYKDKKPNAMSNGKVNKGYFINLYYYFHLFNITKSQKVSTLFKCGEKKPPLPPSAT